MRLDSIPGETLQAAMTQARNYLVSRSVSVEDAEDIIQIAWISVLKTKSEFRGDCKFSTWFVRVVVNAWHMKRRSENCSVRNFAAHVPIDEAGFCPSLDQTPEQLVISRSQEEFILRCIASIPGCTRETFELLAAGWSTTEQEALVGVHRNTLKSRLHRARQKLKELLKAA